MKQVTQLDAQGYFVGTTKADESPLEQGVYMMPARTIEADAPTIPEGHKAKWDGGWVFEVISEPTPEVVVDFKASWTYAEYRMSKYPAIGDQLDALFHAGVFPAEMAAAIQAVKDKHPKGSA
tara:strand:+ start:980 stop:1345 length:366 start_codon:yes stop_codon:yes gene_type:complete